ncbi:MAG TPA: hypothetical protein VFB35_09520 [Gaiellaceae bacterium]|nr:hypothetical protein [Gaiellaceae bacterium]
MTLRAAIRALAGVAAIAAGAYFLVSLLPHPSPGERIAVRALDVLQQHRGTRVMIDLGGKRLAARCRQLPHWRSLVALEDGSRLILTGTRVVPLDGERMLAGRTEAGGQLLSAQADLAGSFQLYSKELIGRLQNGRPVVVGVDRVRGIPALRLRLGRDRPRVELLVSRRKLQPLAARYDGRYVHASMVLLGSAPASSGRGC